MKLDRPSSFSAFVGQSSLKKILKTIIHSSKIRDKMPDHILFYGPAGYGKTTLAHIFAQSLDKKLKVVQGSIFEKKSDCLSFFASLKKNDIIFIDEFHSISKNLDEFFYSALEDSVLDVLLGVDGESKVMRMQLPEFTIIAATTEPHKISKSLFDRFGFSYRMEPYSSSDISRIIKNSIRKSNFTFNEKSISTIVDHLVLNPRICLNVTKRIMDFAIVEGKKEIDDESIIATLKLLGAYKYGLSMQQIRYLKILNRLGLNQNLSVGSISNILEEKVQIIVLEVEPILIQKSFIKISSQGRRITQLGIQYLMNINK